MPLYRHGPYDDSARLQVNNSALQYSRLIYRDLEDELESFCRYVPPVAAHLGVYSTKLWSIIIRASAEIDSQLHALVEELDGKATRTTMADYQEREADFQLSQFVLILRFDQQKIAPFEAFASGALPTWWIDYNTVKHRRLDSLDSSTLNNALHAVAGLYIVLLRQWGEYLFPRPLSLMSGQQIAESPSRLFSVAKTPKQDEKKATS